MWSPDVGMSRLDTVSLSVLRGEDLELMETVERGRERDRGRGKPELIIHSNLPIIQIFCSHHFPLLFNLALPISQTILTYCSTYIVKLESIYFKFSTKIKPCDTEDACTRRIPNENYWKKHLLYHELLEIHLLYHGDRLTDLSSLEPFHEPFVFLSAAGYLRLRVRSEAFGAFRASRIAK